MLDWPTAGIILGAMAMIYGILHKVLPEKKKPVCPAKHEFVELGQTTQVALLRQEVENIKARNGEIRGDLTKLSDKLDVRFEALNVLLREFMHHGNKP